MKSEWDKRFLDEAVNISKWSKDPSTKVGAVIVKDRAILTTGYNGLPRGAVDNSPDRDIRPEKLLWYEHAERNAIYNAARIGIPLGGGTAYSSLCPCMDCARALIQSGIQRVVTPEPDWIKFELWAPQFKKAEQLYKECNVKLDYV